MSRFFLTIVFAFSVTTLCNAKIEISVDGVKYQFDGKSFYVSGYTDVSDTLIIPSKIKYSSYEYPVTSIGYNAFANCQGIIAIAIPNSIRKISSNAFAGCANLTTVSMSDSIENILEGAFQNCEKLKTIVLPKYLKSLAAQMFRGCENLKDIIIPQTVTNIGYDCFYGCTSLKTIDLPQSITKIGERAFYGCRIKKFEFPQSADIIGYGCLEKCDSLEELTLYNYCVQQLTYYHPSDYYQRKLGGIFNGVVPSTLSKVVYKGDYLPEYFFSSCINIKEIILEGNISEINEQTFGYCKSLKKITMPRNLKSVEEKAFASCESLDYVEVPNSVAKIGKSAFAGCVGLVNIKLPNGIKYIDNETFNGCSDLTTINLPDSITVIGNHAFSGCSSLSRVKLPSLLNRLDGWAFSGCTKLTSLTIPDSIKKISGYVFEGCTELVELTFLSSTCPSVTFSGCDNLKNIYVKYEYARNYKWGCYNILYIPDYTEDGIVYCISDSKNLKATVVGKEENYKPDVRIPSSVSIDNKLYIVDKIENDVFKESTNLRTIEMSDSVKNIPEGLFEGCVNLSSIKLPQKITELHNNTFYGCSNLKSLVVPNFVTYIGAKCFANCSSLSELTIPNSVISIGNDCFAGCSSLLELTIPNSVTSIGKRCLAGCSSLEELTIPFVGGAPNPSASAETALFGWVFGNSQSDNCEEVVQRYRKSSTSEVILGCYIPKRLSKVVITGNSNLYYAFYNCTNIKEIILQGDVKVIGECAFYGCTSIEEMSLPDETQVVGGSAFYGCTNLKRVKLPNAIETIDSYAFCNCRNLLSVIIPKNVKKMGENAFWLCYNLQTVEFHTLGFKGNDIRRQFQSNYEDYKLNTIIVGDDVKEVPYNIFSSLKNIKCMSIGNSCTEIQSEALHNVSVDTLHLPKSLQTISIQNPESIKFVTYAGMEEDWQNVKNYSDIYPNVFHYGIIIPGEEFEEKGIYYCANDTLPASVSIIAGKMPYCKNIFVPREVTKEGRTFRITHISDNAFKYCNQLDTIFYEGNKIEWKKILVGKNNEILKKIPVVYNYNQNEDTQNPIESNIMYIDRLRLRKDKQLHIPVNLKNTSSITGFQFELCLPNGFSISRDGLSDELKIQLSPGRNTNDAHDIFKASQFNNGRYLIVCSSTSNAVFSGNDGEIISIDIDIDGDVKDGDYTICLNNIIVSDKEANVTRQKESSCPITLYSYMRGDVNNDSDINIGDISCIANIILGDVEETYSLEAADVNQDSEINVGDIACVGEYVLNGTFFVDYTNKCRALLISSEQPDLLMREMTFGPGETHRASIALSSIGNITAMQFDLELPKGLSLKREFGEETICQNEILNNHVIEWAAQKNSGMRIINYSAVNAPYPSGDFDIINFDIVADDHIVEGTYIISLKNIVLASCNRTFKLGDRNIEVSVDNATNVKAIKANDNKMFIYDIEGYRKQKLSCGLNIVNGRKVLIK